jgi:archaeosine synthase beta-subunit
VIATNVLLRRGNALIRSGRPLESAKWRYTIRRQLVVLDPRPSPVRLLSYIFFRTIGCRYDRAGECSMCNYGAAERQTPAQIVANVRDALAEHDDYDALGITPLGNMFDEVEVPRLARTAIIDLAARQPGTVFSCESRPETLTSAALADTIARLGGKRLFVNLGLEAAHPWVQANCVGKSLEPGAFDSAIALLRRAGAVPVANVLLGAPFLELAEAIESAVGTIRWALAHGTHLCVLFPANVKGWTLVEWLWDRGLFTAPSLWSLVEVLRRLGPDLARSVVLSWYGMTPDEPGRLGRQSDPLRLAPTTCPSCAALVKAGLDQFNRGGDFGIIGELSAVGCECRQRWLDALGRGDPRPLAVRVAEVYERVGADLLGANWQANRARALEQLEVGYDGLVSAA